jgi:hypothetical protein
VRAQAPDTKNAVRRTPARDVNLIDKPFTAAAIIGRAGQILNGHSQRLERHGHGHPGATE